MHSCKRCIDIAIHKVRATYVARKCMRACLEFASPAQVEGTGFFAVVACFSAWLKDSATHAKTVCQKTIGIENGVMTLLFIKCERHTLWGNECVHALKVHRQTRWWYRENVYVYLCESERRRACVHGGVWGERGARIKTKNNGALYLLLLCNGALRRACNKHRLLHSTRMLAGFVVGFL